MNTHTLYVPATIIGCDLRGNPILKLPGEQPVYLLYEAGSGRVTRLEADDLTSLAQRQLIYIHSDTGVTRHAA